MLLKLIAALVGIFVFLFIVEPLLWRLLYVVKHRLGILTDQPELNMGLLKYYSVIIPRWQSRSYARKGWMINADFSHFMYRPRLWETVALTRPTTLSEIDESSLIGQTITGFDTRYGSYGMGGPGFFGITLSGQADEHKILVYPIWGAYQYIFFDGRVLGAHPDYRKEYAPWLESGYPNEGNALSPLLVGSEIRAVDLQEDRCVMTLTKDGNSHRMEFVKNDERLPPHGSGKARSDAFDSGTIGDHLVFKHLYGTLWT